jgi:hypothetical protein
MDNCIYSAKVDEFQGHHTNQAYYKSGIMFPEYRQLRELKPEKSGKEVVWISIL